MLAVKPRRRTTPAAARSGPGGTAGRWSRRPTGCSGVWEQLKAERLAGLTRFAHALHDAGHLRPDVPAEEARDLLWTCNSPETYDLLVLQRG